VDQVLGNLVILLVAPANLALLAGVIIIANAVALAMLERRRKQAVLKLGGYMSGRVLAGVLVEKGVIGGLGDVLGMILVAVATMDLARTVFKMSLAIPAPTTLGLIVLVVAIALATAALVSWTAVRFRPAEVLQYE
jgi:putative ABC transport system permease protein